MATALISFGSNLGDRAATLDSALAALAKLPGATIERRSRWYSTEPVGGPGFQEPFLNGAALIETSLAADELLSRLQRIEEDHGRVREKHWGPRTLDLDLLAYDDIVMHSPRLTLPHPRMSYRRFVLKGVVEIAPDLRHPLLGRPHAELLRHLETAPNYVAFVGPTTTDGVGFRSQFTAEAADCAAALIIEATPRDVPAFAELIATPGPTAAAAIRFVQARAAAIRESSDDAGDRWIVDDGWLAAEGAEIARHLGANERSAFVAESDAIVHDAGIQPKLVAALRTKDETPATVIEAVKRLLPGASLPPIVDLDYSDRERALTEFAAALDAAR